MSLIKKLIIPLIGLLLTLTVNAADLDALKFDNHISGPKLTQDDLKGKIVVAHTWQAH